MVFITEGTIFVLRGEWLDEIFYGVFRAERDFYLMEEDIMHRNVDLADPYIQEMLNDGYISRLNIPEYVISCQ